MSCVRDSDMARSTEWSLGFPCVRRICAGPSSQVYAGARITAAKQVLANGQATWGVVWETLDSVDQVQSFYVSKLNEGDWTLTYNGSSTGTFSAIVSRRSNQKDAGILTVESESKVTHIALALGLPG